MAVESGQIALELPCLASLVIAVTASLATIASLAAMPSLAVMTSLAATVFGFTMEQADFMNHS